jgi:pantetheine-phosphate adenylyltransferase
MRTGIYPGRFEFQLALTIRKLDERVETIFMMPKDVYTFLSSKIVKEIAWLGGNVGDFPPRVEHALHKKLKRKKEIAGQVSPSVCRS